MLDDSSSVLNFKTKGQTLQMLKHKLSCAQILPIMIFTVDDWINKKSNVIKKIYDRTGSGPWIVRSSFSGEDTFAKSNAGAFASVLNVDRSKLEEAVNTVITSYGSGSLNEELFIQPMLKNVEISGVAFSHDPNTGSPDRIINWAEGSDTQAVTAGFASNVWQFAAGANESQRKEPLSPVIDLITELLFIFGEVPIDCEFAIVKEKNVRSLWLLQVRPLILAECPKPVSSHLEKLKVVREKIKIGMKPKPFLIGKRTIYGVMPDWNPAEIIGKRPKPLAISLYQDLITDSIWAYQRHNYGYRNLRSCPLMINLSGGPYIDVRASFNSFIPSDLDDDIAGRLVDFYLDKLNSQPSLHDRVEFEIVSSCYTFDLLDNLKGLESFGFSKSEQKIIAKSLLNLTNKILHPQLGLWRKDAEKLNVLNSKFHIVKSSNLTSIEKIYWLLEDCKRYGTLPFAGLARAAFIGVQMLKSLVKINVLSEKDYQNFMESVSTVSSEMIIDQKTMNKHSFLKKYGHLRPGTYDILSKRYDASPDLYFTWGKASEEALPPTKHFSLSKSQKKVINDKLKLNSINTNADALLMFIRSTIELREKAKFDFTRNLSEAMSLIEKVGAGYGLTLEDLSYCNVGAFRELYLSAAKVDEILAQSIEIGKANYKETLELSLPPLITDPQDVMSFEWPQADPNFITQKRVMAPITTTTEKGDIANKILCIPNADPGYDWIFSYPIAGFITAWGGVNSHMAIRAGEQEVPAIIGAGEVLFNKWTSSNMLQIDCAERRVEVIK